MFILHTKRTLKRTYHMYAKVQIHERNIIMADEKTIINVDLSMFG